MQYKIIGGPLDGQTHDIEPHAGSGTVLNLNTGTAETPVQKRFAVRKEQVFGIVFYVHPDQTSAEVITRLIAQYPEAHA